MLLEVWQRVKWMSNHFPPVQRRKFFELHHFLFRHKFDLRTWFMPSRLRFRSDVICSQQKQKHRHGKFVPCALRPALCHTPVLQSVSLFSGRFQWKLKERRREGTTSAFHHFVMRVGYDLESEFSSRSTLTKWFLKCILPVELLRSLNKAEA